MMTDETNPFEVRDATRLAPHEDPTMVEVVMRQTDRHATVLRMTREELGQLVATGNAYLTTASPVDPVECPVEDPDCTGSDGDCHDACEAPTACAIGTCDPCNHSIFEDERWVNLPPAEGDTAPRMCHVECVPEDADDATREDARVAWGEPPTDWAELDRMARRNS